MTVACDMEVREVRWVRRVQVRELKSLAYICLSS